MKKCKKQDVSDCKNIKTNCIRRASQYLNNILDLKSMHVKNVYTLIHSTLIFLVGFSFIFSINIFHLIVVLIIVSLDAFSIVVLHSCPLTILEKKYMGESSSDIRKKFLKELGISYNCDHEYEIQIEFMINVWILIAIKCLIVIFLKTTNIKLTNCYDIYK